MLMRHIIRRLQSILTAAYSEDVLLAVTTTGPGKEFTSPKFSMRSSVFELVDAVTFPSEVEDNGDRLGFSGHAKIVNVRVYDTDNGSVVGEPETVRDGGVIEEIWVPMHAGTAKSPYAALRARAKDLANVVVTCVLAGASANESPHRANEVKLPVNVVVTFSEAGKVLHTYKTVATAFWLLSDDVVDAIDNTGE